MHRAAESIELSKSVFSVQGATLENGERGTEASTDASLFIHWAEHSLSTTPTILCTTMETEEPLSI